MTGKHVREEPVRKFGLLLGIAAVVAATVTWLYRKAQAELALVEPDITED